MSTSAELISSQPASPSLRGSRLTLLGVFTFFAAPVVFAWLSLFVFEDWRPTGTSNHGELIQPPRLLEHAALAIAGGDAQGADFLQGKWTYVLWAGASCDTACMQRLYLLRQLRLAQGKNIDRVQRLFITAGMDPARLGEIQAAYPGLTIVQAGESQVASLVHQFAQPDSGNVLEAGYLYLVDPMGNLMMRYAPGLDPKGAIKDLERLLRISYVG